MTRNRPPPTSSGSSPTSYSGQMLGCSSLRDAARLALESLAADAILGQRGRHHLDRHGAIEPRIGGAIHLAHAALADQAEDFIRAESSAGRQHRWIGRADAASG